VRARIEGYYKNFDQLLVGRLETPQEREVRLRAYDYPEELRSSLPAEAIITTEPTNDGRGRAWGLDVYLARHAVNPGTRLTGWASYTYGVAEHEAYGRTYPFEYDRRHAGTAVLTYHAGSRWTFSTTARVASGFPYTPVAGLRVWDVADDNDVDGDGNRSERIPARDDEGRLVYATDLGGVSNLNAGRLPFYARVDLRTSFRPRGAQGRWEFYLDVINLLNRENAGLLVPELEYDPNSDRPRVVEERTAALPFLPSLGIRWRF